MSTKSNTNMLARVLAAGLLEDGALLYYMLKGEVRAIGRAREGGIEIDGGRLLNFGAFETLAGSSMRRASKHTYDVQGRSLQDLIKESVHLLASGVQLPLQRSNGDAAPLSEPLLGLDEGDEVCSVCCLGGDLLCCETCPAIYHLECMGLQAMPATDQWYCPACVCAVCGQPGFGERFHPLCQAHWVMAVPQRLPERANWPAESNAVKAEPSENWQAQLQAARTVSELAQVNGIFPPQQLPPLAAQPVERPFVLNPLSSRRYHIDCLSAQEQEEVQSKSGMWFATEAERQVSHQIAGLAAGGMRRVESGTAGQGNMRWQLIRGAAVKPAPEGCQGFAPSYLKSQQEPLQAVLSSVQAVFREAFDPIRDSPTGLDLLPLLLSGFHGHDGLGDFSGFHTAVLWEGDAVVAAALVRVLGPALAEIPFLATRPVHQGKGFARALLQTTEATLAGAGVAAAVMPAWVTAAGEAALAAAAPPALDSSRPAVPWPSTWAAYAWPRKMGYELPAPEERLATCCFPVLRSSATLLLAKSLQGSRTPLGPEAQESSPVTGSGGGSGSGCGSLPPLFPAAAMPPDVSATAAPLPAQMAQQGGPAGPMVADMNLPTVPPGLQGDSASGGALVDSGLQQGAAAQSDTPPANGHQPESSPQADSGPPAQSPPPGGPPDHCDAPADSLAPGSTAAVSRDGGKAASMVEDAAAG